MNRLTRRLLPAAVLAALLALPSPAVAEGALQPFQMVRSLQLVQDRIASGDHAALPMQKKLLEMIDARLRSVDAETMQDPRNYRALLVYAMSGGNPTTFEILLPRLELEDPQRMVATGVLHYVTGNVAQARRSFRRIDPAQSDPEVGAFLSLIRGSVTAAEEPRAALPYLDRARLLAPGTLVEEAALRRTVAVSAQLGEAARFMAAASLYVRRFLRSPYAAQFAETFVGGVLQLSDDIAHADIEEITSWMTREQARTVFLRLARISAIEGNARLLAFASARANLEGEEDAAPGDVRGELYSSISSVTSDTVEEVYRRLERLDPSGLSSRDRALLDAARTVAREVLAPAPGTAPVREALSEEPAAETVAVGADDPHDVTSDLVSSARARLEAIDSLLGETGQ